MGVVYMAINRANGKRYIGKTTRTLNERAQSHKKQAEDGCSFIFHRAIRKYGWELFNWIVLDEHDDKNELIALEIHHIKKRNTKSPNGYNMTDGGEGCPNPSEEVKMKISKRMKGNKYTLGRKLPKWHREKLVLVHTGRKNTEETIEKIRAAVKRYHQENPGICKGPMKGKRHSKKSRRLMSINHKGGRPKGYRHIEETRKKMSESHLGKPMPEKQKRKIRKAIRKLVSLGEFKKDAVKLTINGESKTIKQWANFSGLDNSTIRRRIKAGYVGEDLIKPTNRKKIR